MNRATAQPAPGAAQGIDWYVNTGGDKVHAKRMAGRYRTLKWLTASLWLVFFLGPYLRWGDRQAVLLDIEHSKFHLFGLTVYPYDIWVLSFVLLFFAMLLALVTVVAGRAWCGYFCFQTVWTDLYTWLEERFEGQPRDRLRLDEAPWGVRKMAIKAGKHAAWLAIAMLTGVSFAAWFTDAYQLWHDYLTLQAHTAAWVVLLMFTIGTYLFAGFMREQVCFWLCPYARIQGVLYDGNTLVPTYDHRRGEPRGRLDRGHAAGGRGACVDCDQCVAVCPTGVDIREDQQIGCITCGLCIDACDSVMRKINQPAGLIRYASLNELRGLPAQTLWRRPQVVVSLVVILFSAGATAWGLQQMSGAELSVYPERQPVYVRLSDGSIQNKFEVRIFNKHPRDQRFRIEVLGMEGARVLGIEEALTVRGAGKGSATVVVRAYPQAGRSVDTPLRFRVENLGQPGDTMEYRTMFLGPTI